MDYKNFVQVNQFTPNTNGWTTVGNVSQPVRNGDTFTFTFQSDPALKLQISFLSAYTFRVRFNPLPNFDYSQETSFAVVTRDLGPVNLRVETENDQVTIDTGQIQVVIMLNPYQLKVYRNRQLINQDYAGNNLVYIPGQQVVANFKVYPANAKYCGFGEKAGSTFLKNNYTMTFFNFDNYKYSNGLLPPNNDGGPLNPSNALYLSVPLLIEVNPAPQNEYAGPPYSYGIFFDNPSQSYFNLGASDYSNMFGKYYFGALYGDMDYYFMLGADTLGVLNEYTTLTGRSTMPPKYIFGFHQGAYGYYDSNILSSVANAYRAANIPIDGLHIDVDFQNNYRTFTSSAMKFPNASQYMDYLHSLGFKCSTNITPLLTENVLDENGNNTPYVQREAIKNINGLIFDTRAGQGPSPNLHEETVSYGFNAGSNPFPVPPLRKNSDGNIPLEATGNYPDLGRKDVRDLWGMQYEHLINEIGMDMIWQDMTDPAVANRPTNTFPLDLEVNNGVTYTPHATCHNIYALMLLDATYAGLRKLKPAKRPFIIARGGFAGMQRYAALWTGDSASSWDFLKIYIPEILNISISGVPISGSDIGGFATGSATTSGTSVYNGKVYGAITNYELFTRWMQVGAFLPWYRNHYDGYSKQFQEVYAYGEPVPTNCRKYIELRYRMLQIFYDAMYQWTKTGAPIVKPMFITDGADTNVFNHLDDQFILGNDILIAPIVDQHETANPPTQPFRDVYLPAGSNWYAFMDNNYPLQQPVPGGTLVNNYFAGLDRVPIYIREGAILPMRELEQFVGQLPRNPLTINVYPGKDSSYTLYLDDGISTEAALNSKYRLVKITQTEQNNTRKISFSRQTDGFTPAEEFFFVAFIGTQNPSSVMIQGMAANNVFTPDALSNAAAGGYYWNANIQITFIKVFDNANDIEVEAVY